MRTSSLCAVAVIYGTVIFVAGCSKRVADTDRSTREDARQAAIRFLAQPPSAHESVGAACNALLRRYHTNSYTVIDPHGEDVPTVLRGVHRISVVADDVMGDPPSIKIDLIEAAERSTNQCVVAWNPSWDQDVQREHRWWLASYQPTSGILRIWDPTEPRSPWRIVWSGNPEEDKANKPLQDSDVPPHPER
jgi:hypothetical protein